MRILVFIECDKALTKNSVILLVIMYQRQMVSSLHSKQSDKKCCAEGPVPLPAQEGAPAADGTRLAPVGVCTQSGPSSYWTGPSGHLEPA